MFKVIYRQLNDQIEPDAALMADTLNRLRQKKRRGGAIRRPALAMAALCLCLVLAVPVLAATLEPVYELVYLISPAAAQFFTPAQKSDTTNGIKMEVVSADIRDNVAKVVVTLQDLTSDRIDGTTDLYDSYDIRLPFSASAHCERLGYNPDSRTVTFLITIEGEAGQSIPKDKVTFSVGMFLSDKHDYEGVEIPVDLEKASTAPSTGMQEIFGGSGENFKEAVDWHGQSQALALAPGEPLPGFGIDGIELTGIGYVKGRLHVQIRVKDPLNNDNHGFFYLVDQEGTRLECNYAFAFRAQEEGLRVAYNEFVFDVGPAKAFQYALYGDFYTSGKKTEGGWKVTFPLQNEE